MYTSVWCYNLKASILIHLFRVSPGGGAVIYEYGNAGVHKTHAVVNTFCTVTPYVCGS
jgi:hypothetical protein